MVKCVSVANNIMSVITHLQDKYIIIKLLSDMCMHAVVSSQAEIAHSRVYRALGRTSTQSDYSNNNNVIYLPDTHDDSIAILPQIYSSVCYNMV